MNRYAFGMLARMLAGAAMSTSLLFGQAASKPVPNVATMQAEIDALKAGQHRMEEELAEIKALLKDRGGRSEVPVMSPPPSTLTINVFGEPFKGSSKARVAILEYSDFDCSFCAKYATELYPKLKSAYLDTGKVKYFFRDLPMPEHATAMQKARIARCAGEQDRFWEAHDLLFREQKTITGNELSHLIQALNLEGVSFTNCVGSDRYAEIIRRSAQSAQRMRIHGTPAFLLGALSEDGALLTATKIVLGAESYEAFQKTLDELLSATETK